MGCEELVEYVRCVCAWLAATWCGEWTRGLGLDFTNPVGNMGSVGRVSVFGLRWCGWGVGRGLGPGSEGVWRRHVCVRCESGFLCVDGEVQVSVHCAWRIPAHLRCTQCSVMLHLMDICFLTCICL